MKYRRGENCNSNGISWYQFALFIIQFPLKFSMKFKLKCEGLLSIFVKYTKQNFDIQFLRRQVKLILT